MVSRFHRHLPPPVLLVFAFLASLSNTWTPVLDVYPTWLWHYNTSPSLVGFCTLKIPRFLSEHGKYLSLVELSSRSSGCQPTTNSSPGRLLLSKTKQMTLCSAVCFCHPVHLLQTRLPHLNPGWFRLLTKSRGINPYSDSPTLA